MRYTLTTDDSKIIAKWLRRQRPKAAPVGARTTHLQKAHRPRPRVVQDAGAGNWYVVKVTTRNERSAKADFEETGFEVYLPEFKVERFNKKITKKVVSVQVLFPGYMFVRLEPQHIAIARRLESTIDILPGFPAQPEPVRLVKIKDAEPVCPIDLLRAAQANLELDDTDEARRRRGETTKNTLAAMRKRLKGKPIRIKEGVFEGLPAEVEAIPSFDRIGVLVKIFGRPTSVTLEMDQIEEEMAA